MDLLDCLGKDPANTFLGPIKPPRGPGRKFRLDPPKAECYFHDGFGLYFNRDRERQGGPEELVRQEEEMTRVSDQAKRCGTAKSVLVRSISATCPMSHFFFVEIEQRVKGPWHRAELWGKTRDMRDTGHLGGAGDGPATP